MRKKWIEMIKFIKKYRSIGLASFTVVTNVDTFILCVEDEKKGIKDQIRIKYK